MRKLFRLFVLVVMCFLLIYSIGCKKQSIWNVADFGAIGDSLTLNTVAIQSAIDDCSSAGGGEVLLEGGVFISGTILLKDNVTLHIAQDSKLLSSVNPNHFYSIDPFIDATGQYRGQCLIGAMDAKNIGITGGGVIDGRGEMFKIGAINKTLKLLGEELKVPEMPEVDTAKQNYVNKKLKPSYRPFLIRLVRSENVLIKDINLRQPAAWTLHFYQCKNFKVNGVNIYSHANQNNDGIDIDSSKDGEIINSTIDTGDDAICFKTTSPIPTSNIKVSDCKLSSHWGAIKFGTESMGDFENITVSNCLIHDTKGGGIKILSVDGANIRNINIDKIKMENVEMPIFIRLGERRLVYRDAPRQPVGTIDQVRISNVTATTRKPKDSRMTAPTGIFITGTPNHHIGSIELDNISVTMQSSESELQQALDIPENETRYPEFTLFGDYLPAYGIYARHITGLQHKNVTFSLLGKDTRPQVLIP